MRGLRRIVLLLVAVVGFLTAQRNGLIPQTTRDGRSPSASASSLSSWGRAETLADHFARHGREVGATSPEDYATKAAQFRQRALAGQLQTKRSVDGTIRVFDPQTKVFAAYNADGTTKTFFRASDPSYFQRQPGTPVSPADLR